MTLDAESARQIRDRIAAREISSRDVVAHCVDRIRTADPTIRAFLRHDLDRALAQAEAIDRRLAAGESPGPLAGLPMAVKDNLCTRNGLTTCGPKILANFAAPYDAHVITRLEQAGAIVVGKTNLDEFAMGSSTENSGVGPTHNPWDHDRVPGGSSGGSAAAVAAGMVPASLGSDTGGSIRQPASFCGVVGLKPTYGRVSRYGLVAYGSSLDQIGPITRTVEDAALLLGVIAGHDHRDSTSVNRDVPDYLAALQTPFPPVRLGYAAEYFGEGLDPDVRSAVEEAIDVYRSLGATVEKIHLPHMDYAIAAYYLVATAEASSNLARYDGVHYGHRAEGYDDIVELCSATRAEGFGEEVKRRIMLGTYALSSGYYDAYYVKALKVRTLIKRDFEQAFENVDIIVSPTAPSAAFGLGEKMDDPLSLYLADVYTVSANLAGIPAISIPCGLTPDRLPVGLQLMAPPFAEDRLLRIAHELQLVTDYHLLRPPLSTGRP